MKQFKLWVSLIILLLISISGCTSSPKDKKSSNNINPPAFLHEWGGHGSTNGKFEFPKGVTVDNIGNIYVADSNNNRIQRFSIAGMFSGASPEDLLVKPEGVAINGSNIYTLEPWSNRIQKFNSGWVNQWTADTDIDNNKIFSQPEGIAVDPSGNIYVADTLNHAIKKSNGDGNFTSLIDDCFNCPFGVAVDNEHIFVVDQSAHCVLKFNKEGKLLKQWGSKGSRAGEFSYPQALAVDFQGNVYVADTQNHRIQKFDGEGNFLAMWGGKGSSPGQFNYPEGVAVDNGCNIYIADTANHRIQKFKFN